MVRSLAYRTFQLRFYLSRWIAQHEANSQSVLFQVLTEPDVSRGMPEMNRAQVQKTLKEHIEKFPPEQQGPLSRWGGVLSWI